MMIVYIVLIYLSIGLGLFLHAIFTVTGFYLEVRRDPLYGLQSLVLTLLLWPIGVLFVQTVNFLYRRELRQEKKRQDSLKKIKAALVLLAVCLLMGCNETPSEPPLFGKGDIVRVGENNRLGIVLNIIKTTKGRYPTLNTWSYQVMFQDCSLNYYESDLVLWRAMEWTTKETQSNKPDSDIIAPEITPTTEEFPQ